MFAARPRRDCSASIGISCRLWLELVIFLRGQPQEPRFRLFAESVVQGDPGPRCRPLDPTLTPSVVNQLVLRLHPVTPARTRPSCIPVQAVCRSLLPPWQQDWVSLSTGQGHNPTPAEQSSQESGRSKFRRAAANGANSWLPEPVQSPSHRRPAAPRTSPTASAEVCSAPTQIRRAERTTSGDPWTHNPATPTLRLRGPETPLPRPSRPAFMLGYQMLCSLRLSCH